MHPVPKPDRRSPSRPLDPSTCPECHSLATPALPHRHRRVQPLRPLRLSLVHPEARSNSQQRSGSAAFRMGVIPKRVTDRSAQRSGRSQGARSTTFSPARAPWRPLPQSLDSVRNSSRGWRTAVRWRPCVRSRVRRIGHEAGMNSGVRRIRESRFQPAHRNTLLPPDSS